MAFAKGCPSKKLLFLSFHVAFSEERVRAEDLLKDPCYRSRDLKPTLPCTQTPTPTNPAVNTDPLTRAGESRGIPLLLAQQK